MAERPFGEALRRPSHRRAEVFGNTGSFMKLISTQLAYYFSDRTVRRNIRALSKYVAFVVIVIIIFAVLFHVIMWRVEGQQHSWITGFYWTLTVMSTLGFGDITFTSDIGRLFSIVVLVTGIVLLLIVLPFAFIQFFYAPWLEARINMRAPRRVPAGTAGHVILCGYETITEGLVERLRDEHIPYFVLEPNPTRSVELLNQGVSVVTGEVDDMETYRALGAERARMVVANLADTVNTNITLTVREVAPEVPVVAVAAAEESVDVLELTGASHVLPLKQWLGEHLANRVNASHTHAHVIGRYRDLLIAELPIRNTPLAGRTIRETRLREVAGVNIIAVWERGRLQPARPDTVLADTSVPVITGTDEQLGALDDLLFIYDVNTNPVLVIGGGRVGRAAARALREKGTPVHIVEREPALCARLAGRGNAVFQGDAADYAVLTEAGLLEAPSVLLTTHDDAMNIFLASYCRRLNPDLRIVSRITHERNVESIHRAGADFVLSYASLGSAAILALLQGKELIVLGEGLDLFSVPLPRTLHGKSLAESGIGAKTGLIVLGIQHDGEVTTNPPASAVLAPGSELVMMGDPDQRDDFAKRFE